MAMDMRTLLTLPGRGGGTGGLSPSTDGFYSCMSHFLFVVLGCSLTLALFSLITSSTNGYDGECTSEAL